MEAIAKRSPHRIVQPLLALGAALPFVLSLGFHAVERVPQPVAPSEPAASLAFDQYAVNLGLIEPTPYAFATFRFTNIGSQPVHIKKLEPSCGCLEPQLEKRDYQPGESGRFHVRIRTAREPAGPKEETIRVVYEDSQPREQTLTFKVVLPEDKLFVTPSALFFYQFGERPPGRNIIVTDRREDPLQVTGVESTLDVVHAELGPPGPQGETVVSVTVTADLPPGVRQGKIILATDDPEHPTLEVPIALHGRSLADPARFSARGLLRSRR